MRWLLIGLTCAMVVGLADRSAVAEQRSRETCQAYADKLALTGADARPLAARRRYIGRCMKGRLRKDKGEPPRIQRQAR